MSDLGISGLLAAFDAALQRRSGVDWAHRDRAAAAFEIAKSDHAEAGADPLADSVRDVADRFDLESADAALLTVAVAAELDQTWQLLCGLLSGDDRPARPTVALALELAGESPHSGVARHRLTAGAPLRRHGLLSLRGDGPLPSRRICVDDRLVAHLLGDGSLDRALLPFLIDPPALPIRGSDALVALLDAGEPLVWVFSPAGTVGVELAVAACAQIGVPSLAADLHLADGDAQGRPELAAVVRGLLLEAALRGALLVLAGAERAVGVLPALDGAAVPVVLVSAAPWESQWTARLPPMIVAPRASAAERTAAWRQWFDGALPDPDLVTLRLTPDDIDRVARRAQADADADGGSVDVSRIRRVVRRLGLRAGAGSAADERDRPPASLSDLVLPATAQSEVERLLNWVRYRDDVLAGGPVHGRGGNGTGICALFSGSPGTGKTLAAHVVADTLGMDLMTVDLSGVIDKYIGETEKNLERIFVRAESLNAVLFFDEADALFGSRSSIKDARDRYANQAVAYLLQRMEQLDGVTILATNLRGNLDPAFARRLHFVVHFPDPDAATRRQLWTHHLTNVAELDPADPVDVDVLAETVEVTGGDIRNIVLTAAYGAAAERSPVGMRHVLAGVTRELGKLGRRVPSPVTDRIEEAAHHG